MVKQGIQSVHGIVFDIVEGHGASSTMVNPFFDIDRIPCVPVFSVVLWHAIAIVMSRHERHVSFSAILILGLVRIHTVLSKNASRHGVFRKCVRVRELTGKTIHHQSLQRSLVDRVARPPRVENVVHVTLVRKATAHKKRRLLCFVAVGEIDSTISRCSDFFTFEVVSKVLDY